MKHIRKIPRIGALALVAISGNFSWEAVAKLPSRDIIERDLGGPFQTAVAEPGATHRGPLMRQLEPLLMQQARYLVAQLRPWEKDPLAATLARKGSGEHSIRPNAYTAMGLAILYRLAPDETFPPGFTKAKARDEALALLRFLVQTHGAAGITCDDGKPWKDQWQSAYWAYTAGEACWLLWDSLSADQKWLAARMICDEADRFVNQTPPAQEYDDTKAEENAWNSTVVSLAYNMFPKHPHHQAWKETAIRWIITSFACPRDLTRGDILDGRPVRDWLTKANIHEDYTLENHNRVHPDYMTATTLLSYQVPVYAWGGNERPQALNFNVEKLYASEKVMSFPDGGWVYPNGEDWQLHRNVDWLSYHVAMAVLYNDSQAATLTRVCLETMRRMAARDPNGSIVLPIETIFPSTQALSLEWPAQAYLLMAQLGEGPEPVPPSRLWKEVAGRHVFESGKLGLLRTERSVATFSWGAQVMGMILPLREDLLITPNPRGLIGYVGMASMKNEAPSVQAVVLASLPDALGVTGVLSRGKDALEQRFGFLALPDGRTIYADVVRWLGSEKPTSLDLGTLGVLNDKNWPYHDGTRTLAYDGGVKVFAAAEAKTGEPVELSSRWYNLDGLGIVCLDASGRQRYMPQPTRASARLEQLFHLNSISIDTLTKVRSSAPVAHSVLVFYPTQSIEQTRAAAKHCTLQSNAGADHVQLTLEDGIVVEFDLANMKMSVSSSAATTNPR
jgi:hypothetical protein